MKLTLGQIITLVGSLSGIIPIVTNLVVEGRKAYEVCLAAVTPVWALIPLVIGAISGVFSKSFVETFKESKR